MFKEMSLETGATSFAKRTGLTGRAMSYTDQEISWERYGAKSSWVGYVAMGLRGRTVFLKDRTTNFLQCRVRDQRYDMRVAAWACGWAA